MYKIKKIRKVGAASRISSNSLNFTVQLMDSKSLRIKVNDDFTIKEVINIIAHKLKMYQYETFGLGRIYNDEIQWLNPTKTVEQSSLTEKDVLTFRVKYFKNYLKHVDPVSISLYYEQIKSEIMSGRYTCPKKLCIKLMALQMQIVSGDFNRGTHRKNFIIDNFMDDFIPSKYQSLSSDKLSYFEEKIFFNYRKLKGTDKLTAMKKYITLAKEIKTYGTNWFLLDRDHGGKLLGVCETGFFVQIKSNPLKFEYYSFKDVKYELDDVKFKLTTKEKDTYIFKMYKNYFRDIQMFIDVYTYILKKQGYKDYEHMDINKVIDCPPYWKLERPISREIIEEEDKNEMALEILKKNYLDLCSQNNQNAIARFLLQIEEMLDQKKRLSQLDLRRSKLKDRDLEIIIQAIDVTLRIVGETDDSFKPESVLLNFNELRSGKNIGKLCLILNIEEVDVSSNFINDEAAKDLASYIKECHNLTSFKIDDNHIFNTGAFKLLKALKKCHKIKNISFNNCGIRNDLTDSIEKLCKTAGTLIFDSKKLKSISFQDNVLTDVGMNILLSQIESITRLRHINFVNVHLSRESCVLMTNWLKKITSSQNHLETLKLSFNFFLPQSLEDLASIIDSSWLVLKELEIGSLNIPKEIMSKILISLEKNNTIESLILSGNAIDKKIVDQLGSLVANNRTIKKLGLRNCEIERTGFECIAAALSNNDVIEDLDLAGNDLGAIKAAEAFGKMLLMNKTLKKLNIAACQIIKESFKVLIKAISLNESLEILHLDGNRLKGENLLLLGKGISKNKHLRIVSLQDINTQPKEILPFISELKDSPSLEVVDMRNNVKKNLELLNKKGQHKFALLI